MALTFVQLIEKEEKVAADALGDRLLREVGVREKRETYST
jgi:hypothetical protein